MKTHGFLHITIGVNDLERSTAFYRDVAGCEVFRKNPIMTFMSSGDAMFVLTKMPNEYVRPNPPGGPSAPSTLFHHAFLIEPERFDETIEEFKAKGIEFWDCRDMDHGSFPGRKHVYVHDPDGNAVEFATMLPGEVALARARSAVASAN